MNLASNDGGLEDCRLGRPRTDGWTSLGAPLTRTGITFEENAGCDIEALPGFELWGSWGRIVMIMEDDVVGDERRHCLGLYRRMRQGNEP
jgi:hypothetical protein